MKKLLLGLAASIFALNASAALINIYESNSGIGNIAQAQAVISSSSGADTTFDSSTVFYSDWGHVVYGITGTPFPGGHNTTFVMTASGLVDASVYSHLRIFHDDGVDSTLNGSNLYTYNGNTALRGSGYLSLGTSSGLQAFDLLFWEHGGAATIGVFGLNRSTNQWEVANISSVSEPATFALFGLGLIGLAATRRKTQA